MRRARPPKSSVLQFRMRIARGDIVAVGPGKVDLLEALIDTGSITAAARNLGMSYRRAWLLIDEMNRCLKSPAVAAVTGGKRGGGATVTAVGRKVIRLYREIERKAAIAAAGEIRALTSLIPDK